MALELIKISEFPQVSEPKDWIVVSDANGDAYKISKEDFKAFLGTVQVTSPKPLSPTDPAPTLDGVYKPTVDGTYTNAGGLVVDRSEGGEDYGMSVEILKNGSTYVKVSEPLPQVEIDVIDNLTTPDPDKPLSAKQGTLIRPRILPDEKAFDEIDRPDLGESIIIVDKNGKTLHITADKREVAGIKADVDNFLEGADVRLLPEGFEYFTGQIDRPDLKGIILIDKHNKIIPQEGNEQGSSEGLTLDRIYLRDDLEAFTLTDSAILLPQSIYDRYDALTDDYQNKLGDYITKQEIGVTSIRDMPIFAWRFRPKTVNKKIVLVSGTHASEKVYQKIVGDFMQSICSDWKDNLLTEYLRFNTEIIAVPLLCPANAMGLDGLLTGGRRCAETEPINVTWTKTGGSVVVTFNPANFPTSNPNVSGNTYFSHEGLINKVAITIFDSNNQALFPDDAYEIKAVANGYTITVNSPQTTTNGSGTAKMVVYTDPNRNFDVGSIWVNQTPGKTKGKYPSDLGNSYHDNKGTRPFSLSEAVALKSILDEEPDIVIDCHSGAGENYFELLLASDHVNTKTQLIKLGDVIQSYSEYPLNEATGNVDEFSEAPISRGTVPAYTAYNFKKLGATIEWTNTHNIDANNANQSFNLLSLAINALLNLKTK